MQLIRTQDGGDRTVTHKRVLVIFVFVLACTYSYTHAAVWEPSRGHVQVPIWPGAIPDALPNPKPESLGPPPDREWWPRANDVSRPTMTMYAPKGRNVVGFPEVEAAEAVTGATAAGQLFSSLGDAGLVSFSAGAYGAAGGAAIGIAATPPTCP
jgi:hypothetical protein